MAFFLATGGARAEVAFMDSRAWFRARPLTAGQQVWSVQSSYQNVSNRFSNTGAPKPLGQAYRRNVTWGQLLEQEQTATARAQMQESMANSGARETDVAAVASYDVEREDIGFRLNWAYGLTRSWTIGFDLPVVRRRVTARSRVELASRAGQLEQKVRQASEQQLARSGYDGVPEQQESLVWGDVTLLSQVALAGSYSWQWSLQQQVRFPTARNANPDEYIQMYDDSGQVDLGLTSLLDYKSKSWTLGSRLGYVAQLADSVRRPLSDVEWRRDLGDWWWISVDSDYGVTRRFNLNLEYAYLNKAADRYSGRENAWGTDQELHQSRLGAQYVLRGNSSRNGIDRKWVAAVGYNYPWIGRNSTQSSRATLEIMSYF